MTAMIYFFSAFGIVFVFLLTDVLTADDELNESNDFKWSFLHTRYKRSMGVKTEVNLTSREKSSNYNISTSIGKINTEGKIRCINESLTATNGTFYCPEPGDPEDFTSCCGSKTNQYCCKVVTSNKEKKQDVTLDLITALSIVVGFIVAISCCLLLYCCCCQKRTGVHSGKLVWIKRKKRGNKTVYTTSDNPEIDEDQEGTELVGFMEQRENEARGSRRGSAVDSKHGSRRASKASIDHKHDHHKHDHHMSDPDGLNNSSPVPVVKHVTPSGQVLMVPLINIQGSTPGTSPS